MKNITKKDIPEELSHTLGFEKLKIRTIPKHKKREYAFFLLSAIARENLLWEKCGGRKDVKVMMARALVRLEKNY